jgi:hypothetical protein
MSTALKKINIRVKQLQKKHPGAKRVTLQRQAGAEYRAGKLKPKRKRAAAPKRKRAKRAKVAGKRRPRRIGSSGNTRTATRASTSRNRTATKTITAHIKVGGVRKRKRSRAVVKHPRRRRVGATGMKSLMPILLLGGVGILAYMLLKPKTAVSVPGVATPLTLTGSAARDTAAQNILAYAQAAGTGVSALTALINSLNSMGDASVVSANEQVQSGMGINTLLALPTGGPSINIS